MRAGQVKLSGVNVLAIAELKLSLMTPYSEVPCVRFMELERESFIGRMKGGGDLPRQRGINKRTQQLQARPQAPGCEGRTQGLSEPDFQPWVPVHQYPSPSGPASWLSWVRPREEPGDLHFILVRGKCFITERTKRAK